MPPKRQYKPRDPTKDKRFGKRKVPRPGEGAPPWVPTEQERKIVANASGMGMTHRQIAVLIGKDRGTIERHFKAELSTSLMRANLQVVNNLYKQTETSPAAAKFWLTNRLPDQWKDRKQVDSTVHMHDERPDMSQLSAKDLAQVRQVALMLKGAAARTIEHQPDEGNSHE